MTVDRSKSWSYIYIDTASTREIWDEFEQKNVTQRYPTNHPDITAPNVYDSDADEFRIYSNVEIPALTLVGTNKYFGE